MLWFYLPWMLLFRNNVMRHGRDEREVLDPRGQERICSKAGLIAVTFLVSVVVLCFTCGLLWRGCARVTEQTSSELYGLFQVLVVGNAIRTNWVS